MGRYSEEIYDLVDLRLIDEVTFNKINSIFKEDEQASKFVNLYFKENSFGIYYQDILVGLVNTCPFIEGNRSINIAILNEYRGRGIAQVALEKLVDNYGYLYTKSKMFLANICPFNKNSIKSLENLGWNQTRDYDELMIDEDAEFFILFYKNNPYYEKKEVLKKC